MTTPQGLPTTVQENGTKKPADSILRDKVRSLQLPSDAPPASSKRSWWLVLGVVLLIFASGVGYRQGWFQAAAKGVNSQGPEPSEVAKPATTPTVATKTETPATAASDPKSVEKKGMLPREGIVLESSGYFIPARKILVSPKVSGMLKEFNLQEGQRVKKGQILGVIESVEYESDLQRVTATKQFASERLRELENGSRVEEIEQASAELAETQAMLKKTESDYHRARDLLQKNSYTQAEFDDVFANYQGQKRRVDRLTAALKLMQLGPREERKSQVRAEVAQAEADIMKAKWRLENCQIRSPISGMILTKNAEEGNIVNSVAMNGSYSLCEMADLSDLEVDLKIQERDVARIFVGQKCKVRAIAYSERIYDGVVDRLMPIADRSKGAVPIRVKVTVPSEEEGVYLKPDMSAIVSFYADGK